MSPISCPHKETQVTKQVCSHLLETQDPDYLKYFTGASLTYHLICHTCAEQLQNLSALLCTVCEMCFKNIEESGLWEGILGQPEIIHESIPVAINHRSIQLPGLQSNNLLNIQPLQHFSRSIWIGLTCSGTLLQIDLDNQNFVTITNSLPSEIYLTQAVTLQVSSDGSLAALTNTLGDEGAVLDLKTGERKMRFKRDGYHSDVSPFPIAFVNHSGKELLVHATTWKRLDISDPNEGILLTPRELPPYRRGDKRPEHYIDYFHGRLVVSPNHNWIADDGWIWSPVGCVTTWNIQQWLEENPWESEDGTSKRKLCWRKYFWGEPMCWIDEQTLAVWGYGEDDEWIIPAITLFNVISGDELRWFAGPDMALIKQALSKLSECIWQIITVDWSMISICLSVLVEGFLSGK